MRGLWVLVLWWASAEAATILSRSPVVDVIDGVVQRTQTIVIQCTAADYNQATNFAITLANGTNATLTATCGQVEYTIGMTQAGVVPRQVRTVSRELCSLWSSALANETTATILGSAPTTTGGGPAGRRLLYSGMDFLDDVEDFAVGTACGNPVTAGAVEVATHRCSGGGGVSQEQLDALRVQQENFVNASNNRLGKLEAFMEVSKEWDHAIKANTEATAAVTRNLSAAIQSTDARFTAQGQVNANMNSVINAMRIAQRTDMERIDTNFQDIRNQMASVSQSLQAQIIGEFNRSYLAISTLQGQLVGAINAVRTEAETAFDNAYQRERVIIRGLRDAISTMGRMHHRYDDTRAFTRMFLDGIAALPAGITPFLHTLGSEPGEQQATWRQNVESVHLLYASGGLAHSLTFSYTCNARYLVNNLQGWYTWKDFVETMGPVGCDTNAPSGSTACSCWASVYHESCQVAAGAQSQPSWYNNLTLDASTCTGAISSTSNEYFVGSDLLNQLSLFCDNAGAQQVLVGAMAMQRVLNYTNAPAACDISYKNLQGASDGTGLPFLVLALWERAYAFTAMNVQTLMDYFDGVLPSGISFRDQPFQRRNGQSGTCTQGALTAISAANLLPVYRLDPQDVSVTASATVSGMPAVSASAGLIGATVTSVLPEGGAAVVGDPRSNTTIYDIPNSLVSLSGVASVRENSATYFLMPNASTMTIAAWESMYHTVFNHFAAGNSPSLYETPVNSVTGECTGRGADSLEPLYIGSGSWCDTRALYSVQSIAGQPLKFKAVPRARAGSTAGTYTFTVTIPEGDITQQLVSACPTQSWQATASGALVTLTNARGTAVLVDLVINEGLGGDFCEASYPSLTVPGGGSVTQTIMRCNGGLSQELVLYRRTSDGGRSRCSSAYVNTTSAAHYQADTGNAAASVVSFQSITQADRTTDALSRLFLIMQNLLMDNVVAQFTAFRSLGLPLDNSSYVGFLERVGNLTADFNRTLGERPPLTLYNDSFSQQAFEEYQRNAAANAAAIEAARQAFLAAMANVTRSLDEQDKTVQGLNETLARLDAAREAYVESERRFTRALNNLTQGIVDTFAQLKEGRRDGLFGDLFNALGDVFTTVWDEAKSAATGIWKEVKDMVDDAKSIFSGVTGMIMAIIMIIVAGVAFIGVLYLYKQMRGGQHQRLSSSD